MFVKVFGALVGFILVLHYVNAQSCICKCGPTGLFGEADLCSEQQQQGSSGPLVVRPKSLTRPSAAFPLFGGGNKGPCFRRQALVKPAVVPRPIYVQENMYTQTSNGNENAAALAQLLAQSASCTSHNSHSCSSNIMSQAMSQAASNAGNSIDISRAYEHACSGSSASAPADAVSLAIAYKQAQNNYNRKISEDRLSYGFRKLPIDAPCQKVNTQKQVLPEDSLYTLNGQVVELKPVTESNCESLSEEAQEELLDLAISEESSMDNGKVAKRPSLSELGYGPAKITSATFVSIPTGTVKQSVPNVSRPTPQCDDGFKTGTVEYRDYAKEHIVHVNRNDESCESQEEAVRHVAVPRPICQYNYDGNAAGLVKSFSSAQKSSSSHHSSSSCAQKKSVVFQKMCS